MLFKRVELRRRVRHSLMYHPDDWEFEGKLARHKSGLTIRVGLLNVRIVEPYEVRMGPVAQLVWRFRINRIRLRKLNAMVSD